MFKLIKNGYLHKVFFFNMMPCVFVGEKIKTVFEDHLDSIFSASCKSCEAV